MKEQDHFMNILDKELQVLGLKILYFKVDIPHIDTNII